MRQIPSPGNIKDAETRRMLEAMKESIEDLRAVRGVKIKPLMDTATTADIISKINEILTRIQG